MDKEHGMEIKIARANIEAQKESTKQIVEAIKNIENKETIIKEDENLVAILSELVKQNKEPLCVKLILK